MSRARPITALAQDLAVLGCLLVMPVLMTPQAAQPFVLPKWLALELASFAVLVLSAFDWRRRRSAPLMAAPLDLCALALLLALGLASTRSLGTWTGLQSPAHLLALWVIYRTVAQGNLSHEPRKVFTVALAPALFLSLGAVAAVLVHDQSASLLRAALLGHGNYAGQWGVLILPISAALFLSVSGKAKTLLAGAATGLILSYLLISNCRGAWLALAAATALVLSLRRVSQALRATSGKRLLALGAIAALSLLFSVKAGFLGDRLRSSFGPSDTGMKFRKLTWKSTLNMIASEPLLGVGSDSFAAYYPLYRSAKERSLFTERRFVRSPHNSYLLAAAEAGPLGLFAIIFLAAAALRVSLASVNRAADEDRILRAGAAVAVCGTLIHTAFSFNLESPASAFYFWVLAGVLSSRARSDSVRRPASPRRQATGLGLILLAAAFLGTSSFVDARRIVASADARAGSSDKQAGDLARAEESFRASLRLWPESANTCQLLARVMMQKGDLDACRKLNEQALDVWPYFRDSLLDIGLVNWRQNRFEEAERFMKKALDVDPAFMRGRIALGNLCASHGDYGPAIEQYKCALGRRWSREQALYYIAAAKKAQGKMQEARLAAERIASSKLLFLDKQLSASITAETILTTLSPGEKSFYIVARDRDLWPVWKGKMPGRARIEASPPTVELLAPSDGVTVRTRSDGGSIELQFRRVKDSRVRVYSLALDEHGVEKSFDFLADAEFHSKALALYGQILASLGETDEAKQMLRDALRIDPSNAQARQSLSAEQADETRD